MITRKKQNYTNSTWKPFATSTPLRLIPDKKDTDGVLQKQCSKDDKGLLQKKSFKPVSNGQSKQIPEQNGHIAKKFKRNRSNFYFDAPSSSSSSEDENDSCLSNNGPTIKINLEGSAKIKTNLKNGDLKKKILISPKNSSNESNKIIVENSVNVKSANNKATENGKPDEMNSSPQKLDSEMNHSFRSRNSNYDYEDKKKENSVKKKGIATQNESNSGCKNSKKPKVTKVDLNGCKSNSSTESSSLDLAPSIANGKSSKQHNCNLKSKKNENIKSQNSFESEKDVSYKRKRTKSIINADPVEKKRVKNGDGLTSLNESPTNQNESKPKIKKFRKDSSHQLFSDSMHQELINTLDLTNGELDNEEEVFGSPWKRTLEETLPKRTKLKGKAVRNITYSPKRSVRQRQQPREFWMPRNQCDLLNKVISISKDKPENEELLPGNKNQDKASHVVFELENELKKQDFNQGNLKASLNITTNHEKGDTVYSSQYPNCNEVQNKKDHVQKNKEKVNAEYIKAFAKNVKTLPKTKKLGFTQKFPNKTSGDAKKSEKDENEAQGESDKENKTKMDENNLNSLATNFSDVFKQLNQLPTFENYVDGVQTAECWSLKNFKCGILKVHNQHQISNKTSFDNSYFGGVLIKGGLKMKIGSKDLEINQGDMAFVPPLTEWSVIGTHEGESLFYYWCGRFKT